MDERQHRKKTIEMKQGKSRKKIVPAKKKRKNNEKRERRLKDTAVNQNLQPQEIKEKPKKYVSKKRIKRRNRAIAVFTLTVLLVAALTTLSLTVFFPIKTIKISGNEICC